MEPLLALAADLEARDLAVAAELARVEALQADVDEIRTHAEAAASFLASLPAAIAAHARDEDAAEDDRAAAQQALHAAEDELAAERARDRILDADRRAARAREHQAALEREGAERRDEVVGLCRRAGAADLPATIAWASHRRGELLVERSNLARERDAIVREASELLGSVTGDAFASTSVAGLRDRLHRALP